MSNTQKSGTTLGVCVPLILFPNKLQNVMQETSQKTKYSIKKRLLKLPGTFRDNKYKLCIELSITEKTLSKWMELGIKERFSIPTDAFYTIAGFLDCMPTDLMNMPDE